MSRWQCRQYRALLVDRAEGSVTHAQERRLEQHLHTCAACREELTVLREMPALLRTAVVPEPNEDFWRQQRQAIGQAIRNAPATRRRWHFAWPNAAWPLDLWRYPIAVAAALLVAVGIYRFAVDDQPQPPSAIARQLAGLDTDSLAMLHELMQALVPADEQCVEPDDAVMLAAVPLSDVGAAVDLPPVVQANDLSDNELEGLDTLVGNDFG